MTMKEISEKRKSATAFKSKVEEFMSEKYMDGAIGVCGLCYALRSNASFNSYDIIFNIAGDAEFGNYGVFTDQRRDFLLLLNALSVKDIMEFCHHD